MLPKIPVIIILCSFLVGCSNYENSNINHATNKTVEISLPANDQSNKNKKEQLKIPTDTVVSDFTTSPSDDNSEKAPINSYILPNSDKKIVSTNDLYFIDNFGLTLARNEIFARHGYVFKDAHLSEYFSNMPWYKSDSSFSGNLNELSEIEQNNVKTIKSFQASNKNGQPLSNLFKKTSKDGIDMYTKTFNRDLDGDGNDDKMVFTLYSDPKDNTEYSNANGNFITKRYIKFKIDIYSLDKKYTLTENFKDYISELDGISFCNFDIQKNRVQFYLSSYYVDNCENNSIYEFTGSEIKKFKEFTTIGGINYYDGKDKLYSNDNYEVDANNTLFSYYTLENGLTFLPKSELIGKYLTFDYFDVYVGKDPKKSQFDYIAGYDSAVTGFALDKNNFVERVKTGEKMKILDVLYERKSTKPYYKVQTEDGKIGWCSIIIAS